MAKGSISSTTGIPFGWFGVAVKLVRPGLGSPSEDASQQAFSDWCGWESPADATAITHDLGTCTTPRSK